MKSLVLKHTFFLCLLLTINTYAQSKSENAAITETAVSPKSATAASDSLTQDLPDMAGMPIMTFDKKTINFGRIRTGDKPEVIYNFTNTGDKELDILIVSSCDCTSLDWTKTTVKPGEKGFIKAVFNSDDTEEDDHKRPLKKPIDIILNQNHPANNYPIVVTLDFEAFIID